MRYEAVRCNCGWPIFRIYPNGVSIKHHSCEFVTIFPWAMLHEWAVIGSAMQGVQ
jgi:hypothetical protein